MSNLKLRNKIRLLSLISTFLVCLIFCSTAKAQEQKGLTVSPSIVEVNLDTDETEVELFYENNSETTLALQFSAVDFTELEEGAKVKFLEGEEASNYKYSLSSWITFEREQATISPGETLTLKISIARDELPPGAHYASVQAIIAPETVEEGNVNISGVLSSLLFVTTSTGSEIEEAQIAELRAERSWLSQPDKFILRFNNKGNIALVPHGLLQVFDPFGREVARGILNEGSLKTLPETIRRYEIATKGSTKFLIPGPYTAKITTSFGKSEKEIVQSVTFFALGSTIFSILVVILPFLVIFFTVLVKKRSKKTD